MTYVSHVLYHFVGSSGPDDDELGYEVLRKILDSKVLLGREVAGSKEGRRFQFERRAIGEQGELMLSNRVCVCDIPRQMLGLHAQKYGRVGIGVDRAFFAAAGGMPVIYIPVTSDAGMWGQRFLEDTYEVWDGLHEHFRPEDGVRMLPKIPPTTAEDAITLAREHLASGFMPFIKRFDATLPQDHPHNYYMEREWRKLGRLPLETCLREVVVPATLVDRAKKDWPELAEQIFPFPEAH